MADGRPFLPLELRGVGIQRIARRSGELVTNPDFG